MNFIITWEIWSICAVFLKYIKKSN